MINWLRGTVQFKDEISATVVVADVGYRVFMLEQELGPLTVGSTVELYIHPYHRENSGTELYGFKTKEAQLFFDQLLSISGIGPKGGMSILAQATPHAVQQAIQNGDSTVLTKVSGIGKKTAERIIVELRGKLTEASMSDESIVGTAAAIDALRELGYTQKEAREALQRVPATATTLEAKVKAALQQLGAKR